MSDPAVPPPFPPTSSGPSLRRWTFWAAFVLAVGAAAVLARRSSLDAREQSRAVEFDEDDVVVHGIHDAARTLSHSAGAFWSVPSRTISPTRRRTVSTSASSRSGSRPRA